jgi:RNA polymerase sigma-70 factor (ECF subfamily)
LNLIAALARTFLRGYVGAGYTALAVEVGLTLGGGGQSASARSAVGRGLDDEAVLVDSLARGETQALEIIYERYSRGVYSLGLRLLGDGPLAEEVVQETFLKLWRQPRAYQSNRGRLLPWLLGVAHHHAVDVLRRRQLEQRHRVTPPRSATGDLSDFVDDLGLVSDRGDPAAQVDGLDQRTAIRHALDLLPVEQRVPLELAYYRGMTQLEVATLLEVPLGTIKTRMRLGLQHLRKAPELVTLWSER